VVCLFGQTGSGKTEVYLQLAQEALENNKQALICVPEIGLTPQMVDRVQKRFGKDVIVYHSHLNDTERYLQYQRVLKGEKTVVVGTRSAIFLPFQDLALIVLDEEHDSSYKQDSHPRYHTRDIAIKRAETHQSLVVLGSATPSFETFARATKGNYELVRMPKRVSGELPQIFYVSPERNQRPIWKK
jgi:primosomal protein N' (replication factor Y)